jgi:hypothetical protein
VLRRRRRIAIVLAGLAAATVVVGVASTRLPVDRPVKVLAADQAGAPTPASSPSVPSTSITPSTADPGLIGSRPPSGAAQECSPNATEPSMGNGYCGPEPRAGNGDGPDGLCTGREPGPPCGPGVEPGRWYPYTLAISCDAHALFDGRRWISTLGPPPGDEAPRHVWIQLYSGEQAGVLSPTMAVGYKLDPAGPATTCPPPPTPPSTVRATTTTMRPPTTTTSGPASTSTTVSCRNSRDSSCGQFRWDPEPSNEPLRVQVTVLTASPRAGEPVQFRLVVDDDDKIDSTCRSENYGDGGGGDCSQMLSCPQESSQPEYGPWTPPSPQPDHYETVVSHIYGSPGTYDVSFKFRSQPRCGNPPDPYRSEGTATTTIIITT